MDFQSVLFLLHVASLVAGSFAFLVLLKQLIAKVLAGQNSTRRSLATRSVSYTMLTGIFLICFSAGGLLCFSLLTTSQLPNIEILVIRILSLSGIVVSCCCLHVLVLPMVSKSQGGKLVDSAAAMTIIWCSLAASVAIISFVFWILSGTHAPQMQELLLSRVTSALAFTLLLLWGLLTIILLGERGIREIKSFALKVKKSLEPPTRIELQRAKRAQRMQRMNLPLAPRRRQVLN